MDLSKKKKTCKLNSLLVGVVHAVQQLDEWSFPQTKLSIRFLHKLNNLKFKLGSVNCKFRSYLAGVSCPMNEPGLIRVKNIKTRHVAFELFEINWFEFEYFLQIYFLPKLCLVYKVEGCILDIKTGEKGSTYTFFLTPSDVRKLVPSAI